MASTNENVVSHFSKDKLFFLTVIRSTFNLLLFLTVVWYFFTYGKNDLALTETMDTVVALSNILPYLFIPLILWAVNRMNSTIRTFLYNVLLLTAFGVLIAQSLVIWINPIFMSRWTWAFNDLRELNYLQPAFKIILYMMFMSLFILDNREIASTITYTRSIDSKKSSQMRIIYVCSSLLAFVVWGILQAIFSNQPIWISTTILMNLVLCEVVLNIFMRVKIAKSGMGELPTTQDPLASLPMNRKIVISFVRILALLGFLILSALVWLFPAQMVYQEGPSNPWSNTLYIAAGITALVLILWWKKNISGIQGFLIVVVGNILAPICIMLGWKIIPGTVDTGLEFVGIAFVLFFAWILYFGNHGEQRNSAGLQQWFLWIWGLGCLVLMSDPLLEIWEMEEGLIEFLGPDIYGTGVGLYYGVVALVWGVFTLIVFVFWLINKSLKSRSVNSPSISQESSSKSILPAANSISLPLNRLRTEIRALIIIGIVGCSGCLILTAVELSTENPTIVARMGDHGVLWKANSYDRVLQDYRPNFATSPFNSTIDIYAMRGETETIQLVFTPLASKMISFNKYQWFHNLTITKADNLWLGPDDNTANISIEAGRIGYLSAFDPNIADVILPWSPFITGDRKNIPFWLDVAVPNNTAAGIYTTRFQFDTTSYLQRIARTAFLNIDLRLTVWNFTKPMNRTLSTCINYIPESTEHIDNLVNLGLKYGIDPYGGVLDEMWGKTLDMVEFNASDLSEGIVINWTRFDEVVERKLHEGMCQIKLDFYPGIDCRSNGQAVLDGSKDNELTIIRWFYENASIHLSGLYTPWGTTWESETITQHSDEPDWRFGASVIPAFTKLYTMMNETTKIKNMQTLMYEPQYEPWLGLLDIWIFTPDSYTIEDTQTIRAAGGEVWTYSNGDNYPGTDTDLRTPLIMSRLRGWVDYKYNITGFLHWVFYWNFNDAGRSGSGYDGRGDGTEIVPFLDTYLPTLRLVAFRDSIEDYELLYQLGKSLETALDLGLTGTSEYQKAKGVLDDIKSALSQQPEDVKWSLPVITREFNHTPSLYLNLRIQAGNALDNLLAIL
jgi:hypothetical protein